MSDTGAMQTSRSDSLVIDATVDERVPDRERDFAPSLALVAASPRDAGIVHAIVARPGVDRRVVVTEAVLDETEGLVGDDWQARGSSSTPDGRANPESQLTIMSTRVLAAIEPDESRWPLAGDQLLVDFDLSLDAPAGGDAHRRRRGGARDQREAAHRLREVQRPVRLRRAALDQLAGRPRWPVPRRERPDRPRRHGPDRRRHPRRRRPHRRRAYQTSPSRHSQVSVPASGAPADGPVRSTISHGSSSAVCLSVPSRSRTNDRPAHRSQPSGS